MKESVLRVHHWTDTLFSFVTTRDPGFRFASGQFTMMGLEVEGRPLLRAYSMVSAHYDDHLEFLSIKVPGGPLTSRLQHLKEGDQVLVSKKATGTLVLKHLLPGKNLYMLSTGTGLAPFLSLAKDPEMYEQFDRVILTHTCRRAEELAYHDLFLHELPHNEFFGELVKQKLTYYPSVTREDFRNTGRITDLIQSEKLFKDVGLPPLNPEVDRVMLCGSPGMLADLTTMLEARGFREGTPGEAGHYVTEKAFAER
ncbi:ferredoxin--NADP reductase [Corallococcus caeni]|uniref:ferredoxin--NADP(+) reductase n=2 Tax=Corallococcus TaxID=83461 RepID=A0A7Y4NBR5_9BACT|nr:ferredoxin--NADP reductase [Corallococcus exercitus]NOK08528.1 ferredoxin--NADP reductase [Corallococcus exercitus]GMU01685.1 ferredoxin--NADP reductase [Corallococcus sp. KH5-1]